MIREKFLELKLQPSCDNLESTLHAFHDINFDHSDYDSLRANLRGEGLNSKYMSSIFFSKTITNAGLRDLKIDTSPDNKG